MKEKRSGVQYGAAVGATIIPRLWRLCLCLVWLVLARVGPASLEKELPRSLRDPLLSSNKRSLLALMNAFCSVYSIN